MSKYNYEWAENVYKTPPALYNIALEHYGIDKFDIDTCCTDENIPAKKYFKSKDTNGLEEEWEGVCWCNPPFNECKKWIQKAAKSDCKIAMLIPARTETAYWHDYILYNPNVEIKWLRKGYKFLDKDNNEMGVFKNALAIVYFNNESEK